MAARDAMVAARASAGPEYAKFLTQHAAKIVAKQVEQATQYTVLSDPERQSPSAHTEFLVQRIGFRTARTVNYGSRTCTCRFWTYMKLPCRHLIAVRGWLGQPEVQSDDCHVRWLRETNATWPVTAANTEIPQRAAPPANLRENGMPVNQVPEADQQQAELLSMFRLFETYSRTGPAAFGRVREHWRALLSQIGIYEQTGGRSARNEQTTDAVSTVGEPLVQRSRGRPRKRRAQPGDLAEATRAVQHRRN